MLKSQGLIIVMLLMMSLEMSGWTEKPKVLATMTIIADIAKNVGGDFFEIGHIVPVGKDPHTYEPIPQDAERVVEADLILMNGLTLEGWLTEFVKNSGTKARIETITTGIKAIKSGNYDAPDPHAWMDALNGIIYAENIKKALIKLLPEQEAGIESNFQAYKTNLETAHQTILASIESIPQEKRVLITSHDAFQYFGDRYGIRLEAVLGTSTEADAQTSDISRIYQVIETTNVPAVFIETTINPKMLKQIARDKGVKIGGELFADSLGDPSTKAGTYIGMLTQNVKTITNALTQERIAVQSGEHEGNNWLLTGLVTLLFIGGMVYMFGKMNR